MPRAILNESDIHPAVRASVASHHHEIVDEVAIALPGHAFDIIKAPARNLGRENGEIKRLGDEMNGTGDTPYARIQYP